MICGVERIWETENQSDNWVAGSIVMFQFRHGCRYLLLQALDETPVTVNIFSTVSASLHHSFKVWNPRWENLLSWYSVTYSILPSSRKWKEKCKLLLSPTLFHFRLEMWMKQTRTWSMVGFFLSSFPLPHQYPPLAPSGLGSGESRRCLVQDMSYLAGAVVTWWYYGGVSLPIGQDWQVFKDESCSPWPNLSPFLAIPLQVFLGKIQNESSMAPIKGCLKLFSLHLWKSPERV